MWLPRMSLGHFTHEKNPVALPPPDCDASGIEEEKLVERARTLGLSAKKRLEEWRKTHPLMGDVRGLGLILGIERLEWSTRQSMRQSASCMRLARWAELQSNEGTFSLLPLR